MNSFCTWLSVVIAKTTHRCSSRISSLSNKNKDTWPQMNTESCVMIWNKCLRNGKLYIHIPLMKPVPVVPDIQSPTLFPLCNVHKYFVFRLSHRNLDNTALTLKVCKQRGILSSGSRHLLVIQWL